MTFDEYFRQTLRDELETRIAHRQRLTQAELSESIGKSSSWIGQYFSGNVECIDADDFVKACQALGISPSLVMYKFETDGK